MRGDFSGDDSSGGGLCHFGKEERNVILGGGISGGFDGGAIELIQKYMYNEKMMRGAIEIKNDIRGFAE